MWFAEKLLENYTIFCLRSDAGVHLLSFFGVTVIEERNTYFNVREFLF